MLGEFEQDAFSLVTGMDRDIFIHNDGRRRSSLMTAGVVRACAPSPFITLRSPWLRRLDHARPAPLLTPHGRKRSSV
jgi:hypothetical protein